ncbi:hypothetical protein NDU88_002939 [Pleurodeles waltl]|uniref:Uncharacterized protein n=1 Tax=Pleurodeles waltl TaxID=8319 RepID=A0AAV7VDX8_PLEWA|nr:hypothetical protein NDU88_002939 [Pleurodeles waltl]
MAPKATRNPGDKNEGVKTTRVGRDKGEPAGVNKRLTSIVGKPVGKKMLGLGTENLSEIEDSNRKTREKELGPQLGASSPKHNNLIKLSSQSVRVGKEKQVHQDLQRKGRTYITL